ncbi:MAG: amidohydrolase family protein [Acidimicrobiia bacterium]|nr:amidohydrolase family protein [Acidimicrobiia bacterium]
MPSAVTYTNVQLPDGSHSEIHVSDGRVVGEGLPTAERIDVGGMLVLPALAEPHCHLDKAYLADRFPNPSGDLISAIEVMHEGWPDVTEDDIYGRAARALREFVAAGTTAVRTHADLNPDTGMKSVRALIRLRDDLAHLVDIQVVALASSLTGGEEASGRRLLAEAVEAGIDLVGSCPNIEDDPGQAIETTLGAARETGLGADLHLDEVLDARVQHLELLAAATVRHGLEGRVTASHCVSHGLLDPVEQRRVGAVLADAGISVVANPRTNLFLQGRGREQATPRGMTGVAALLDTGVPIAAGSDNLQDPFFIIGRADPLETAAHLVSVAHRTVDQALHMVTGGARAVMGVETPGFEPGDSADFVAVRAASVREAVAEQPTERVVIRRGRVVAKTSVERWMADA